MSAKPQLKVTSHVGRDLLASAASFKNEAAVVWEYVVNSLQYVDPGVSPRIQVTVLSGGKGIRIADNGCGMSVPVLNHFFQMHGENLERRAGRLGRGKFGTGKSAALGIANTLCVGHLLQQPQHQIFQVGVRKAVNIGRRRHSQNEFDSRPLGNRIIILPRLLPLLRSHSSEISSVYKRVGTEFAWRSSSVSGVSPWSKARPTYRASLRTFVQHSAKL